MDSRSVFALAPSDQKGGSRMISEGVRFDKSYRTYSMYSDRQVRANIVDPDQTPQHAASDQGYTVRNASSNFTQVHGK